MGFVLPLVTQLAAAGLPSPETEYEWCPGRGFRADWAWPDHKLIVEKQGGGHVRGRHHRHGGYQNDCRRSAEAQLLGWRIVYVTPEMIASGEALSLIRRALEA